VTGRRARAAVVYNAPSLPPGHPEAASEADVVAVASAVADALSVHGFETVQAAARPPLVEFLRTIERLAPDVLFNLIEGFAGSTAAATHVTGLLELTGVPYTGSPVEALAVCIAKSRAKALLRGFGLPTAPSLLVNRGEAVRGWEWEGPALVKPDAEDGSLGIEQASVVADPAAAAERVARIHAAYGCPALVEAYLPGPEFNVGVLALPEPEALPVAEVVFQPAAGAWPILTYAAKWSVGSEEDLASPVRCPARIDAALAGRLERLAIAAFAATGCRDYARVDIRLDSRGEPMILEVNPNPDIGPTAGWARALRVSGRDYGATVAALAAQAAGRITLAACWEPAGPGAAFESGRTPRGSAG
jgi:D-alanine-D-alanine ligase